ALSVGSHLIQANYSGNSRFAPSLDSLVQQVLPDGTTTTLASYAAQPSWGESLTLTATVAAGAPGAGLPTGTVTFLDVSTALATVPLQVVNGVTQATFFTASLEVGDHRITAVYDGDANFLTSTSDEVRVTVEKAVPTVRWGTPADFIYGTTLGSNQLNA